MTEPDGTGDGLPMLRRPVTLVPWLLVGACSAGNPLEAKAGDSIAEDPGSMAARSASSSDEGPATCTATVSELRRPSREAGIELFVQRARSPGPRRGRVVLTHGAGSGGSATWNLPGDYSILKTLACAGFDAYGFDARGFGGSTLPEALRRDDPAGRPVATAAEVQADLQSVIDLARDDSGPGPIDLVGWSWGCVVAGRYASTHPEQVRRLVLIAPVWDRRVPTRHIEDRAWREEKRALHEELTAPGREDPVVHRAFVEALFRFAPGDVLRLPNGPYLDLYGPESPTWRANPVTAEVLIVRGEDDRASTRPAALRLFDRLSNARGRAYVEIGDAGHFLFRRRGYRSLHGVLLAHLQRPPTFRVGTR